MGGEHLLMLLLPARLLVVAGCGLFCATVLMATNGHSRIRDGLTIASTDMTTMLCFEFIVVHAFSLLYTQVLLQPQ